MEDPDQTVSDLSLHCLFRPLWQETSVQKIEHLPYKLILAWSTVRMLSMTKACGTTLHRQFKLNIISYHFLGGRGHFSGI